MIYRKLDGNRLGGLFAAIFGLLSILEAARLYPSRTSFLTGDHIMPGLTGIFMISGGLFLYLAGWKSLKGSTAGRGTRKKMTTILILLFSYVLVMEILGYGIATFFTGAILFKVFGSYNWGRCAVLSAMMTGCILLVFVYLLDMPFPAGMIFSE